MAPGTIVAKVAEIAKSSRHLSDGRSYRVEIKVGLKWVPLMTVNSTFLCDQAVRFALQDGGRARGMPC